MQTLLLIPGLGSDAAVWRRTIAALGDTAICQVGETLCDPTLHRREPPPIAPITISQALVLRHPPLADCARYDLLRGPREAA